MLLTSLVSQLHLPYSEHMVFQQLRKFSSSDLSFNLANDRTTQLLDVKKGGKRYADTGVLISDFVTFPFESERHARALARTNWLHSHYGISNDDKLYTLSVFVIVPRQWLEKYEWRSLRPIEIAVRQSEVSLDGRRGGFYGGK
jgi:hypothetical protein